MSVMFLDMNIKVLPIVRTSYFLQCIRKCCSSPIQLIFQTKHFSSSICMDAPLFSNFPVCMRKSEHLIVAS